MVDRVFLEALLPCHADVLLHGWLPSPEPMIIRLAAIGLGYLRLGRALAPLSERAALIEPDAAAPLLLAIGRTGGEATVRILTARLQSPTLHDAALTGLAYYLDAAPDTDFPALVTELRATPRRTVAAWPPRVGGRNGAHCRIGSGGSLLPP